jgi:hypothetical protein
MTQVEVLRWLDSVIAKGVSALASKKSSAPHPAVSRRGPDPSYTDLGLVQEFRAAGLSFIRAAYGVEHSHYTEFNVTSRNQAPEETMKGLSVLRAVRGEIEGGYLGTVRELLRAEVFANFLEMAEHLLEQGYKDPAAVMIGSVLEEHLRQVATRNNITLTFEKDGKQVPKKADTLNAELAKVEVYNKLDQKAVTAWLDLRNNAAHGKYAEYTKEQVQLMLQGVLDFVRRVSLK